MKKITIFIVLSLFAVVAAWLFITATPHEVVPQAGTSAEEGQEAKEEVVLAIYGIGEEKNVFTTALQAPMTASALLEAGAKELGLGLKIKTSDIGTLVEAIGGKENGEDGKYWLYYVNGKMPMMAVDKYLLNPGDTMEFKFEKSPF